ncbi:glycosyltransferase family 2 protein [Cognatishimia sp. SS12]|uniref:glycosyltransferase family 2 protein n=1 Tax=Cognatishimia sp. SS12 TaxID=2979465 RepID=UPI00232BD614|nr:glycosyltransferase family 2 protein [Cognatishimia sp. SS12]MDC0737870.1 glycosyltransferase family 2 protein [Cognatishimia sp. SS12]
MKLTCVTSVRDEGPYLLEWIAHHKAAGVTDFLVYSNDCSDGTDDILKILQRADVVRHVPQEKTSGQSVQWQALKAAWKHPLCKKADWIWVADCDEFINVKTGSHRFQDLIAAVSPEADAIALQWRLFGHNDIVDLADAPVTQQFTRAIAPDAQYPIAASLCKTLFRPAGPFNMLGVHRPKQKDLSKARRPIFVDGGGAFLPESFAKNPARISLYGMPAGRGLAELNHYAIRSAMAFLLKRARGLPNRKKSIDLAYWVDRNFNQTEDRSIDAMRPATEAVLQDLLKIPGLQSLHEAAVAHHRAKFETLIAEPDNQKLMTQILTAGSSVTLPADLQKRLISWYHQAQSNSGD